MQCERGREKKKQQDEPNVGEEDEHDAPEFFFIHLKQVLSQFCRRAPERHRRAEKKKRQQKTDGKCAEEKIPKENRFFRDPWNQGSRKVGKGECESATV